MTAVTVRFPKDDLLEKVKESAQKNDRSQNSEIIHLIRQGLYRENRENPLSLPASISISVGQDKLKIPTRK